VSTTLGHDRIGVTNVYSSQYSLTYQGTQDGDGVEVRCRIALDYARLRAPESAHVLHVVIKTSVSHRG
jgi:hypothetical protein